MERNYIFFRYNFHKNGNWWGLSMWLHTTGHLSLVRPKNTWSALTWHFSVAERSVCSIFMRAQCRGNEAVLVTWTYFVHLGILLFDLVFNSLLCFSRALRRPLCYCHICFCFVLFFSILLLHVCYVCTAVSQQANSALKVFPSFFVVVCFVTLKLFHSLGHWCIR